MNGIIFDLKEFAIYDGPGVRQTVFLKGCPLGCPWCHNPEGQRAKPELTVSLPSCIGCGKCGSVCGRGDFDRRFMRSASCDGCGRCVSVCPAGIRRISGRVYSPQELASLILRGAPYYTALGGGVTFSGGEPLMQSEFLCETLDLLPGVHKAIETSGFCSADNFRKVINRLDYIIMDVKLTDAQKHEKYTGVSNLQILQNYGILRESGKPHIIRIPLIPSVNCDHENLESTAKLLSGDPTLEKVELLPYHKTAGAKYSSCGREYVPLSGIDLPVKIDTGIFMKYGVNAGIL